MKAGWKVAGRVANALSFFNSGLIKSPSMLANTLSRYTFSNGKYSTLSTFKGDKAKVFQLGILSILGTLYSRGVLPLKSLMTALVNPHYEDADYSSSAVGLPTKASLEAGFSMLCDPQRVPT